MTEGGVQLSGYIDIKQPPKVKGRKLKSWRKKWVVLQEMTIRSASERAAAKVDVYADEKTASASPADKQTFILEFVTDVRAAKSKTHNHAFEIVENEAVLLLAGATELETQTWVAAFKKIFWPGKTDINMFPVEILENEHTSRLGLQGSYQLSVNPEVVAISSDVHNSYEWSLHMLKRFHLEKNMEAPSTEVLVIESGPKSECGEAEFRFTSDYVALILQSIKRNIFIAINLKENEGKTTSGTSTTEKTLRSSVKSSTCTDEDRVRSETCSSTEQRFRDLLENTGKSKQQTAVSRMTSVQSDNSNESEEPPEIPKKKRQSVTFDTSSLSDTKPQTDLLSTPIEISVSESEGTEYNHVELSNSKQIPPVAIISTFTVDQTGNESRVLLDEHGYSHVDMRNSKLAVSDEDKSRSLSNVSSQSSMSHRSASVGSKDSGIANTTDNSVADAKNNRKVTGHRSTNSFDSAVSTSSTTEVTDSNTVISSHNQLTVEIQEIEMSADDLNMSTNSNNIPQEVPIYQDVSMEESKDKSKLNGKETVYAKPSLKKSSSTGNFKTENEYEDLNVYRKGKKNLIKHLGMDPFVDPSSVPPALPERPLSHKLRRKSYNNDKRLFTLPFRNKKKMRERAASISSSSSGGSDDGGREYKKGDKKFALKAWPLGNKSVIVDNEGLYQPVAIQRFLKDNEGVVGPQKRERSSSLNINTANLNMKRPSIQSAKEISITDKKNAMWKHNRNVSLQMDMLSRFKDSDNTILDMDNDHITNFSVMPELGRDNSNQEKDHTADSHGIVDEPIYAELEPTRKGSSEDCAEPFPNLTLWKPIDISDVAEVSELNGTNYENDESMTKDSAGDVFNQGFVVDDNNKENKDKGVVSANVTSESLLIDLSDVKDHDSSRCMDIFNMGVGPSYFDSSPIIPSSNALSGKPADVTNILDFGFVSTEPVTEKSTETDSGNKQAESASEAASESIYMDMSSCKTENIYVLPSSLQRSGKQL